MRDLPVLAKDVSGNLEVAGSSAVRKGKMNHKAEITETAAGIQNVQWYRKNE